MSLEIAPLAIALFFIAAMVLSGFTLYAHRAGKIRRLYTAISGALLGVIFAILVVIFTANMAMASAVGLVIFGWFLMFSRPEKPKVKQLFNP